MCQTLTHRLRPRNPLSREELRPGVWRIVSVRPSRPTPTQGSTWLGRRWVTGDALIYQPGAIPGRALPESTTRIPSLGTAPAKARSPSARSQSPPRCCVRAAGPSPARCTQSSRRHSGPSTGIPRISVKRCFYDSYPKVDQGMPKIATAPAIAYRPASSVLDVVFIPASRPLF